MPGFYIAVTKMSLATYLPLRHFKASIASSLIAANKPHRGRPSIESISAPKKRKRVQSRPEGDVRTDVVNHMPAWDDKCQRCSFCSTRSAFTHVKCLKCNVFLCFTKDRNCFKDFHLYFFCSRNQKIPNSVHYKCYLDVLLKFLTQVKAHFQK